MKDETEEKFEDILKKVIDAEIISDIYNLACEGPDGTTMKEYKPRNRAFSVKFHNVVEVLDSYNW